jgi:hypothetical protein
MNAILALGSLLVTLLFWRTELIAALLLILIAAWILWRRPRRSSFAVYGIAVVFGPLTEMLAISQGAWTYADPHLGSIPLWLPFLWGNAGLFLISAERFADRLLNGKTAGKE